MQSTDSLTVTDAMAAEVAVAPRISKQHIEDKIKSVSYMNAFDAMQVTYAKDVPALGATTLCFIAMQNGFVAIGSSSCVDHRNYDVDVGRRLAYEDAFRKIWPLEAYLHLG